MISKVFKNILTNSNIHKQFHNPNAMSFTNNFAFSKKKGKSYNISGIDEKKLPPHLKKAYQAKK